MNIINIKTYHAFITLIFILFSGVLIGQNSKYTEKDYNNYNSKTQKVSLKFNGLDVLSGSIWNAGFGDQPDIAIDSKGNVHIVTTRYRDFTCYYRTHSDPPRYTIFQWETFYSKNEKPAKFQVVLYESGKIQVNIDDNSGGVGNYAITGVNHDQTHGVNITEKPPGSKTSWAFMWDNNKGDYNAVSLPGYLWLDVLKDGEQKPVWVEKDDWSAWVPIGFNFNFYGSSYQDVYVSSNGYLSFKDSNATDFSNPLFFPSANSKAADVIAPLWSDWDPELKLKQSEEIFYSMVDGHTGEVLISQTLISNWDSINSTRPTIAVDQNDNVHITWNEGLGTEIHFSELYYTKLNPYLDDRNGTPAYKPTITVVNPTKMTNFVRGWVTNPRMVVDNTNHIHIVWENVSDGIYYMQISTDGTQIVEPTLLRAIPDADKTSVDIAVDSHNNPHIVWNDRNNTFSYETYYMMLDGQTIGTQIKKKIDATLISTDDNKAETGQSIVIDYQDKAHLFWLSRDELYGGNLEISWAKIDPSVDNQNGDSADPSIITVAKGIKGANDNWVMGLASATNNRKNIHLSWWERNDRDIHYKVLDTDGNDVIAETKLTSAGRVGTNSDWMKPYLGVNQTNKAYISWFDWRGRGVYLTTYQAPANKNISNNNTIKPEKITLYQNYPNPFNPSTNIRYKLEDQAYVIISIYDVLGKNINTLISELKPKGEYNITWNGLKENGNPVSGGIYFYKIQAGNYVDVKKMVYLK